MLYNYLESGRKRQFQGFRNCKKILALHYTKLSQSNIHCEGTTEMLCPLVLLGGS